LARCHAAAKADETVLRLSLDAKATVAVGLFSRGGRSRVVVKALDHDFNREQKLTPFGIFLPDRDELYLYFTASRVTSDFIADCLDDCWKQIQGRFPQVKTLLLNLDNGPENHSRRTQFMKRMSDFADQAGLTVSLAYYPPYHSKYNPIERVWGVLEQHWNGSLLESVEAVLGFARSMKWKGEQAKVHLVERTYQTGVRLTQKAMARLEKRFERLAGLERWFVRIAPQPQAAFG
jgi:transposase